VPDGKVDQSGWLYRSRAFINQTLWNSTIGDAIERLKSIALTRVFMFQGRC